MVQDFLNLGHILQNDMIRFVSVIVHLYIHTQSQIYPDLSCGLAELPNAQACGNSLKNSKCLSHLVATMPKASGSTSKVVTLVKFSSISSTLLTNYHNQTNHRRKRATTFFYKITTLPMELNLGNHSPARLSVHLILMGLFLICTQPMD